MTPRPRRPKAAPHNQAGVNYSRANPVQHPARSVPGLRAGFRTTAALADSLLKMKTISPHTPATHHIMPRGFTNPMRISNTLAAIAHPRAPLAPVPSLRQAVAAGSTVEASAYRVDRRNEKRANERKFAFSYVQHAKEEHIL